MTFSLINPLTIDAASDVLTNVASESLWDVSTAYTKGDIVERSQKLWQALQDNTGEKPTENGVAGTEFWAWVGIAPLHAPFDINLGTDQPKATETEANRTNDLYFTITIQNPSDDSYIADVVGLTGLKGSEIEFGYGIGSASVMPTGPEGSIPIPDTGDYYGSGFNLPIGSELTVNVRWGIVVPVPIVAVSGIIIGQEKTFDVTWSSLSVERLQRSIIEDNGFIITVTPRLPGRLVQGQYMGSKATVDSMSAALRALASTATMYSHGSSEPEFLVYGFNKRVKMDRRAGALGEISLDIESLR